ncbi:Hypothetical protein A7982_03492 [Minicystis rosea]|nr:Hypothetical protein A7982_03492 [Minicystis rosea]
MRPSLLRAPRAVALLAWSLGCAPKQEMCGFNQVNPPVPSSTAPPAASVIPSASASSAKPAPPQPSPR